ncbi:30S ribosomal protein S16 [bacterium]|nr:30S ribosomal protein S16 [bacterium]
MLVIRLARGGRNKYATYRIVAAEKRFAPTGKYVEVLGRYNPHTKELVLDKEGIQKRVGHGAQPSNSVLKLMQREGMELPKWAKVATKDRKPKKEPEVTEEAVAEVVADNIPNQEAPADPDQAAQASGEAQEAAAEAAEAASKE